jgi:membrane protease YdiL (CAAX protease family)
MNRNTKKIILFIGLTFGLCWLMAILFYALGGTWNTTGSLVMATLYMFVPMIMAVVVQKFIYKEPLKKPLGISFKLNWWFLVAWLLPPIIAFATLGVSLLFPHVEFSPEMTGLFERFKSIMTPEQLEQIRAQVEASPIHPLWLALFQGLIAGITINAITGFGEELGWRGFLQHEFRYLNFWKSSLLIGVVWGVWHTPIILQGHNYPQHPLVGVFMMIIWCILLTPIFSYIRLKARSVIAAAIVHGSLNATMGLSIMVIKGGNDLLIGGTGLAGFIVLGFVNLGLFIYDSISVRKRATIMQDQEP